MASRATPPTALAAAAKAPALPKTEPPKPSVIAAPPEKPRPVAAAPVLPQPVLVAQAHVAPKLEAPPPPPSLPPELAALDTQFIKLQGERVTAPYAADLEKLNTGYLGGIAKKIAEENAAGHLDGILALEAEQKLLAEKQSLPDSDDAKTPASLKTLRAIYREQIVKLTAQRAANLKALTEPLNVRLAQMETDFTKSDRVADAKLVRGYREALAESTPGLQSVIAAQTPAATTPPQNGLKPSTTLAPAALLAAKDGVTNTLGMKFVPVPGTDVLFCIHETRRQDSAAYAAEVPGVDGSWKNQQHNGIPCGHEDNHPAVGVSWEDANAFCKWLSKKEGKTYRLPTDKEWSYAVGIGRDEKWTKDTTPEMLNGKVQSEFPWEGDYPPKTKDLAGNYVDTAAREKFPTKAFIEGYTDGFATTAPVMSFKPNKLGLYDMGGNACEWVDDWWNAAQKERALRGASFDNFDSGNLLSSRRFLRPPTDRPFGNGFRVVLVR